MRRLVLACISVFVIGAAVSVSAAADLTREQRAKMENALLRELTPTVGVFDYVAFQLDEKGTVTLLGQVRDANLKKHVEEDSKKVEGVARVRNQIEVLPPSPTDEEIRRAMYNAIYSQTGFARYTQRAVPPVHIIVKNGSVRLEGAVATRLEYAHLEDAATGVPGVFAVKTNVRVDAED